MNCVFGIEARKALYLLLVKVLLLDLYFKKCHYRINLEKFSKAILYLQDQYRWLKFLCSNFQGCIKASENSNLQRKKNNATCGASNFNSNSFRRF